MLQILLSLGLVRISRGDRQEILGYRQSRCPYLIVISQLLAIFESLLPVFVLIALGFFLKRIKIISGEQWRGLERISFYVFFPALLFRILSKTDFYALPSGALVFSLLLTIGFVLAFGLLIRLPVQAILGVNRASYSSLYQGFGRWNAFIGLAVVEKLIGPEGLPIVAIIIATVAIPTVLVNVSVVGWLGDKNNETKSRLFWLIAANPLIIGAALGLSVSLLQIPIYAPIDESIELVSRMTLPLGLIMVGTGLTLRMPRRMLAASIFGAFMKLIFVPAVYVGFGLWFGLSGNTIIILGICGAVPSAMNGYLIAREMGGDAPLYASTVTLQTVAAFFTMPLIFMLATYLSG